MSELERIVFWLLFAAVAGIAGRRLAFYFRSIRAGRGRLPRDRPLRRLKAVMTHAVGQWPNIRTASTKDLAGPGHLLIFWGAVVLALYYVLLLLVGEGFSLSDSIRSTFTARLLLAWSDVFSILLAIGMLAAALRRTLSRPKRLGPDFDSNLFWGLTLAVLLLVSCYFGVETLRLHLGLNRTAPFLTTVLAEGWATLSMTSHQAALLHRALFWTQYVLVLTLIVYGTYSNHRHPLFSPIKLFFQSFSPVGHIPLADFTGEERFGASRPEELDKNLLLDGFACTQCGRCQESCPAHDTEKPLSPKQLILDINRCLLTRGSVEPPPVQRHKPSGVEVETLLSCTTCGSCIETCPVSNRPLDSIIELRRHLVYEGIFEPGHATTLRRISLDANPWGIRWHRRARHFDLPLAEPSEHYDCIYWLGCTAAFDDRARRIAEATAAVLKRAGVRAAILGSEEKCCGDAARRIGDEGLFQRLAVENIRSLDSLDFDFVLTHCPHCFNSLTNDYQPMGASFRVLHHSLLLRDLIRSKRIDLDESGRDILYHDPCYLGRYHNHYRAPREVLQSVCSGVSEFERNKANSFCCGAGGGHMWKTEEVGRRMSVARVNQALQTSTDHIASACPFCLLMFEEAVQTLGPERPVSVSDIAEVVEMYMR
jgi:Fe-S oxidoreductase